MMEMAGKKFWSYRDDGMDLTIWNSQGRLLLSEPNKVIGRFDTVQQAIDAAVVEKRMSGVQKEVLDALSDELNWQSGTQNMARTEV